MRSVRFDSVKDTTRKLFLETAFDWLAVTEAVFVSSVTYTVDGRKNTDLSGEEKDAGEENVPRAKDGDPQVSYALWEELRPVCFGMIRGKTAPASFRIVFFADAGKAAAVFSDPDLDAGGDISGYLLVVSYRQGGLTATTGTSYRRFSMDRNPEKRWDTHIFEKLDKQGIRWTALL